MSRIPPRRGRPTALLAALCALATTLVLAPGTSARPAAAPARVAGASATGPWSFSGSGFGHGVGMSQYGALAQAKAGRSAAQILGSYYSGTTYDQVTDTQTIRVNIVRGRSSQTIAGTSRASGGGTLTVTAGSSTMRAAAGTAVSLRRSGSSVVASCSSCSPTSVTGSSVRVTWDESRTDLNLSGKRYRHAPFVVTPTPGASTIEGVLHLRLSDEYLDQVREVPWGWPAAALQAQAAAARAYALRKVVAGVRAQCACHVQDGVTDQVYGPVPVGSAATGWSAWRAAVAAGGSSTTGYVPRYGGQVIEALYSSSSGGHTVNNEDVWGGTPVPYLRGVPDSWSTTADNPRRAWTSSVTSAQLADAFDLPDVASLDLSERTSAGSVRYARATSASGTTRALRGDEMRRALGLSSAAIHRPTDRISGSYPPDLAAASARAVPLSADTVVIASTYEEDIAHLVMARPLAGALQAPLLLSGNARLTGATRRELDRRGSAIRRAYVVAGGPMVGSEAIRELRARGITVTRVGLSDKDYTSAAVVDLMARRGTITRAGIATSSSTLEASAFSAVAGTRREPIVWATSSGVGWRTLAALDRAGVGTVRMLGSTRKVPQAVEDDLRAGGLNTQRFGAATSTEVAADLAHYFRRSYPATRVVLARTSSGQTIDAVLAAGLGAPVLVVTTSASWPTTGLVQRSPQWPAVTAFGSATRVGSGALTRVRDA